MVLCAFVWDGILHTCKNDSDKHRMLHLKAILLEVAVYCMTPLLTKSVKLWHCTEDGNVDKMVPYAHSVLQSAPFVECSGTSFYRTRRMGIALRNGRRRRAGVVSERKLG